METKNPLSARKWHPISREEVINCCLLHRAIIQMILLHNPKPRKDFHKCRRQNHPSPVANLHFYWAAAVLPSPGQITYSKEGPSRPAKCGLSCILQLIQKPFRGRCQKLYLVATSVCVCGKSVFIQQDLV